MKHLVIAATFLIASSTLSPARAAEAPSLTGLWDAIVVANGAEVPFRFEIAGTGAGAQGFFFEGDRKIGSTAGSIVDGVLKLEYEFLNTVLEATLDGGQLVGTYRNKRPGSRPQDIRMRRFTPIPLEGEDAPPLAGTWEMRRNADEVSAPRRQASTARATGRSERPPAASSTAS